MATVTSNLSSLKRDLHNLADVMNVSKFRRSGKSVGEELLDFIAEQIQERVLGEQTSPDGSPLAPNKEPYASSPGKAGKPITVLTGDLMNIEQVKGDREINYDWAEMEWGTTQDAKNKAEWLTEGNPPKQEPRPVYDLDDKGIEALWAKADEILSEEIEDLGGEVT